MYAQYVTMNTIQLLGIQIMELKQEQHLLIFQTLGFVHFVLLAKICLKKHKIIRAESLNFQPIML